MGSKNQVSVRETWLTLLRARFMEVARRRVAEGAVEDIVQDALAIVCRSEGHGKGPGELPPLPWCFQILRNVIGNHYQKERTRRLAARPNSALRSRMEEYSARVQEATPIDSLEHTEQLRLLNDAIDEVAAEDRFCGDYFRRLLSRGSDPARPSTDSPRPSTHYVRHYRCRQKLRRVLEQKGYLP